MATAAGPDIELNGEERQFLELVYEHFDREMDWPEPGPIKRQLYQRGFRNVDIDALLTHLGPALIREVEISGRRLRLTLAGLRAIHRTTEPLDFICFLRFAVEKYGEFGADKNICTADLVARCGLDSHRLRKLDALLRHESFIARPTKRAPDGGPFEWEVDDEVTRYQDVFDIDTYLVTRRRELEGLAKDDIPPVRILAAEGIPFELQSAPASLGASDAESTHIDELPRGLHPLIEQQVRPQFLIHKYDLGVFAALKAVEVRVRKLSAFSNELVGVDLMNRAFGPGGPLADASLPKGEQEGLRSLFAGPYAVLRNPAGHRDVNYEDVPEAADGAHVASLLMRILDRIERRRTASA